MSNEIAVTCFADLVGSTSMTEKLGHEAMKPYREEYLRVGQILTEKNNGKYIKNIGDCNMSVFKDIQSPLLFAAQIQQFYEPQPNYLKAPLVSRIGLFLGLIDESECDAYGAGVNQASRVEGKATPGSIWLNRGLYDAVNNLWGTATASHFLLSKGEFELKGIANPPKQELFSFNWQEYVKKYPDKSLCALVVNQFQQASVVISNLSVTDMANKPSVIWPVTPRDGVNAIHCGQIEIIRLLAILGSSVHVLIADCSVTNRPSREYSEKFRVMLDKHASDRGLRGITYRFMSDLFTPRCEGCNEFHQHFQNVISQLTLQELLAINQKEYAADVREAIKEAPTLDFLHPALTIAAVLHLCQQIGQKSVVIVGQDERIQWEGAHVNIPKTRSEFGVLFNPVLNAKEGNQGRQTGNWPLYFSWQKICEDMKKYELASWLAKIHVFLSSFPASSIEIGGKSFTAKDFEDNDAFEKKINKEALAEYVFRNL